MTKRNVTPAEIEARVSWLAGELLKKWRDEVICLRALVGSEESRAAKGGGA
jgi:hypothetical protein